MGWEFDILNGIQSVFQSDLMDQIIAQSPLSGTAASSGSRQDLFLLYIKKTRTFGICILTALVFEVLSCNVILKPLVARPRPFTSDPARILLIPRPEDYSFPSGHTAVSFAAASAAWFMKKRKTGVAFGAVACLIAFSRLYLYVHYPTDVLAGAVIGILCGAAASKLTEMAAAAREARRDSGPEIPVGKL